MNSIILAFIAGVFVGIVFMRIKYGTKLITLMEDFEELKFKWAVLRGQYEALRNAVIGPEKGETEDVLPQE